MFKWKNKENYTLDYFNCDLKLLQKKKHAENSKQQMS